jgi:hypothetical protein
VIKHMLSCYIMHSSDNLPLQQGIDTYTHIPRLPGAVIDSVQYIPHFP